MEHVALASDASWSSSCHGDPLPADDPEMIAQLLGIHCFLIDREEEPSAEMASMFWSSHDACLHFPSTVGYTDTFLLPDPNCGMMPLIDISSTMVGNDEFGLPIPNHLAPAVLSDWTSPNTKRKFDVGHVEEWMVDREDKETSIAAAPGEKKATALPQVPRKSNKRVRIAADKDGNADLHDQSSSSCGKDDDTFASQNQKGRKWRSARGSATDSQSLYARRRRERINERLRILQNLVPNGTKVDISTMLDEAVQYVKFLQLQIKLLSSDELWMYAPVAYNGVNINSS